MSTFADYVNEKKKKKAIESAKKGLAPVVKNNPTTFEEYATKSTGKKLPDLAPVKTTVVAEEEEDDIAPVNKRTWFNTSVFDDGYQFGDISKAILGTGTDVGEDLLTGIIGMGEKAVDAVASIAPYSLLNQAQNPFDTRLQKAQEETFQKAKEQTTDFVKKDLYNEQAVAKKILSKASSGAYLGNIALNGGSVTMEDLELARQMDTASKNYLDNDMERDSLLGEKSDALVQSAGQLLATAGLQSVGVPWWLTTGATSFGAESENALNQGATLEEAVMSGAISAGAEILTEKLSGGISFGGKTLDDALTSKLATSISNKLGRNLLKVGMDFAGEGAEEVLSSVASNLGSALYREENLSEILASEEALDEYIESFIGGGVLGGVSSAGKAIKSEASGVDYVSGLTETEKTVVDKVYKDAVAEQETDGKKLTSKEKTKIYDATVEAMEKGYIDTDTIESVLGGETYNTYKSVTEKETALKEEYNKLNTMKTGEMTGEQLDRRVELKRQLADFDTTSNKTQLREQLDSEMMGLVNGSRLSESYNERSRRGQVFEADLTRYDSKQQETVKKAIESGILNNTNRTHDFVDMVAKLSADKGVLFDFANNKKLKESGFSVDGKTVNGFIKDGNITLNIDSSKALNSVVGHEITHVLEGTELYTELQKAVRQYADTKGEYAGRVKELIKAYNGIDADIEAEVTADLIGDYLFTDSKFINRLSAENPNIFKRIFDEIKYMFKVATAGSKEKRQLEKVKREFEKAYREVANVAEAEETSDTNVKYSIREEAPPKKTGKAYKVFLAKDGGLYPPMVANPNGEPTPIGVWLNADVGEQAEPSKTGRPQVQAGGKGTNVGKTKLAFRPGWHLGDIPHATQFAKLNPETGKKELFPANFVWAEVEYAMDNDYQEEAMSYGYTENGKFRHSYAGLPKLPSDGYYRYRTNPNPDTVPWIITGAMRVNRILTDAESDAIVREHGVEPMARQGGAINLADFGIEEGNVKYSLSDSDGKQLTAGQQEYFKDSKMRDDNGNLKVMYHGSEKAGFHEFKNYMSDDNTSFFFTDDADVAKSYSGTKEEYSAKTLRTADDLNTLFAEIDQTEYEAVEQDGEFVLFDDGEEIARSDSAKGLYDEWTDYTGLGYGNTNYKVYLNLKNPLIVDAKDNNWNAVGTEFSQEFYDKLQTLTAEEKAELHRLSTWDDISIFEDEITEASLDGKDSYERNLASAYQKLGEDVDMYRLADIATENFSEESMRKYAVKNLKTRDYAQRAKEQGYDGVIFKNIVDNGVHAWGINRYTSSTVAIAFDSNQIKSVANENPTSDADIRYSLSEDSEGNAVSPIVQKRFANSKAVDENGSLKVLYHGTASGEFSIFDKSKGSVEGDFGSGFYFTDSKTDVERNYEDGGPDFDNKVARRAEQIEQEEDIDYEEAEERARNELYKGGHKFEVYLNVENPAIVGETMLLDNESYLEEYSPNDYDDYDDYLAEVEQLVADDIDRIVWDIEKNVDIYSTDGIADVLWEAYSEGGIGIEELKAKLNDLYLEDNNGNLVANEVARQIVESLGYDGIIDSTVSSKFSNMGMEEGTTHYIVFKPNQIKAITNQNPTDNPNINLSLSGKQKSKTYGNYNVYGKDIALEQDIAPVRETVEPFTEDYAPLTEAEANVRDDAQVADRYFLDQMLPPTDEELTNGEFAVHMKPADPFYEKDIWEDGRNRKVKAYMYEHPEVKPFFQQEALYMMGELDNSVKGERMYNDKLYYDSNGEQGFFGTTRFTSDEIAYLLDEFKYTYKDIYKGLQAIIEDNGKENNAISKRIEFLLDERLRKGYTHFLYGDKIPPNQDYINLLNSREITAYNDEAWNNWLYSLSDDDIKAYFSAEDSIAPPPEYVAMENAPAGESTVDDIAPVSELYEAKRRKGVTKGQLSMFNETETQQTDEEHKIAEVLVDEPEVSNKRVSMWSKVKNLVLDKGLVFEDLSLKTKNRELQARFNSLHYAKNNAQRLMEKGNSSVKSLKSIREKVESEGKQYTKNFFEYMYHKHNVDRMSLETEENRIKREKLSEKFKGYTMEQVKAIANERFTRDTPKDAIIRTVYAQDYLETLQHANKPVFGVNVTAEVSKATVSELEKAHPEFKEYAEDVYSYLTYLRQKMVDSGVISKETADLWAEMYPHYVPIRRVGDEGLNINVPLDTNRTGVNAPIKGATGGNRNILNMFDTIGQRTMQTYSAVAKNSFGVELKNTLKSVIPEETKADNIEDAMHRVETHESLLQEGKDGRKPTFTVFENGKRVTFEITEEMYDALKPTNEALTYTNKTASAINDFRRNTLTQYNPWFMLKNAIKDTQDILINSQHPARTYATIPKAIHEMTTNGKWYKEYMENGGEQNSYFDTETNTFKPKNKTLELVKTVTGLKAIAKANDVIERLPRLSEYIASRESGRSIDVSMLDSARVTTNFSAGGDLTKFLNRNGFTFLNASVQGALQQVRNVREAKANGLKGWVNLAGKTIVAGIPAFILNNLIWDDDEEYEELSDYVKQNYYIVGKFADGKFVRIPKGRTVAVIQNAMEQIQNAITGDDEVDLKNFIDLAITNLAPNNPLENNIIAPIIQVKNNKTWYGDDLVPSRLQDLPDAEQYDESTDVISRWLGETFNVSPYKANYLLDQYSGIIGDTFLPTLTPEAESGDNSFAGNMIAPLKDMFTADSVLNNQNVSDFYDRKDELTKAGNSMYATDEDILSSKYMNSVNTEIGKLYGQKREIQNSNLSDSLKYEAIREIQEQIDELAESGLSTYNEISYEGNGEYAVIGDRYYKQDENGEWQKLNADATTKYLVTSKAGEDAHYASDGEHHYYWYEPGEGSKSEAQWKKISEDDLEKQNEVTEALGITPEEYWSKKEEYTYAYKYPGKYAVSKAVGGYDAYKGLSDELNDIKADKDSSGESIAGSAKEKKITYIDSLDIDYGQKIILFRSLYSSKEDKATYNADIVEYLNGRDDISYEDMVTILEELDMKVSPDGTVTWE